MIDFTLGWRAVPGMFSREDGGILQEAVRRAAPGTAVVETGAWCGRSLAAACEVLPDGVRAYSIDNYLEDSQAAEGAPIRACEAKRLREVVAGHYRGQGRDVTLLVGDAVIAGMEYSGPPISVLFIDDHHSAEQLEAEFEVWLPHMAERAAVLLHDYAHPPYGLIAVAERMLPGRGYNYLGRVSGIGVWDGSRA